MSSTSEVGENWAQLGGKDASCCLLLAATKKIRVRLNSVSFRCSVAPLVAVALFLCSAARFPQRCILRRPAVCSPVVVFGSMVRIALAGLLFFLPRSFLLAVPVKSAYSTEGPSLCPLLRARKASFCALTDWPITDTNTRLADPPPPTARDPQCPAWPPRQPATEARLGLPR